MGNIKYWTVKEVSIVSKMYGIFGITGSDSLISKLNVGLEKHLFTRRLPIACVLLI